MQKIVWSSLSFVVPAMSYEEAHCIVRRNDFYLSPNKVIRLTQATIKDSTYHVKIGPVMSDVFKVGNGLKQGKGPALGLFIAALECVANNTSGITVKWRISYKALQLIGCTDDTNVMGRTKIAFCGVHGELKKRAKEVGLNIIVEKKMVENRKTGRRRNEILTDIMTLKLLGVLST